MAKHRSKWNYRRYHNLLKEGRGQGVLGQYLPWITIHDIASRGVSSRIPGCTTGRIHHTLSKLETAFFYILDASDKVLDIREQFPLLPVEDTVRIAESLGIRHPRDNASKYPYVMTTDFVITTQDGLLARSIKPASKLSDPRVREKLEIERRYWKEKDIDWKIVTENEIDFQKASNLEWIYRSWSYPDMLPEGVDPDRVKAYFLKLYHSSHISVAEVARRTEGFYGLRVGLGVSTFQRLLLEEQIDNDLGQALDLVSVRTGEGGEWPWISMFA